MATFNVKLWSRPETQSFIKRLREAGYSVVKDQTGKYSAWNDGALVFCALPGARGYLCRVNSDYVQEKFNDAL